MPRYLVGLHPEVVKAYPGFGIHSSVPIKGVQPSPHSLEEYDDLQKARDFRGTWLKTAAKEGKRVAEHQVQVFDCQKPENWPHR